jgi:hypothetical protein
MAPRYGLFVAILVGIGITGALWWQLNRDLEPAEQHLFEKLDFAMSGNPPRAEDVVKAFDLGKECVHKTCFFDNGQIGSLQYGEGNIRPAQGLIFVLEDFAGACIRVDRVESHFGTAQPEQSCAHGGCWTRISQREWGIIGFGLKDKHAQCASSVVINTRY